jgi:uncharacterized protein
VSGGTDVASLLANMDPTLSAVEVVFCSFPNAAVADKAFLDPIGCFMEPEGLSLMISRRTAETHGSAFSVVLQAITLNVHSSLEAVGLTAAVAGRLTQHGISANIVAAYYHDHVFVPAADTEWALAVLRTLQAEAVASRGGNRFDLDQKFRSIEP